MKLQGVAFSILLLTSFMAQTEELTVQANKNGSGGSLNNVQKLGSFILQDPNLSLNRNQSCASCHSLQPVPFEEPGSSVVTGFVDADNVKNGTAVSKGSITTKTGRMNAPTLGYAAHIPAFHRDTETGAYVGGLFWNGRAKDLNEQARGPFTNPVEMAMPDEWAVVERYKERSEYQKLFLDAYRIDLNDIPSSSSQTNSDIPFSVMDVFIKGADAVAEFERTRNFNKFTSKYDYVLAGKTSLTDKERTGLELFNGKAQCTVCHSSEPTLDRKGKIIVPPTFATNQYGNLGLPRNINIPGNPEPSEGLGGRPDIQAVDPDGLEIGKHKMVTLRNIALTPPYGHNGVIATLEQAVHFYNTRDTLGYVPDVNHPNFGITGWPSPEVPQNMNTAFGVGNMGLTDEEEAAIVAFMRTLTDDYQLWGNDPNVPEDSLPPFDIKYPR